MRQRGGNGRQPFHLSLAPPSLAPLAVSDAVPALSCAGTASTVAPGLSPVPTLLAAIHGSGWKTGYRVAKTYELIRRSWVSAFKSLKPIFI